MSEYFKNTTATFFNIPHGKIEQLPENRGYCCRLTDECFVLLDAMMDFHSPSADGHSGASRMHPIDLSDMADALQDMLSELQSRDTAVLNDCVEGLVLHVRARCEKGHDPMALDAAIAALGGTGPSGTLKSGCISAIEETRSHGDYVAACIARLNRVTQGYLGLVEGNKASRYLPAGWMLVNSQHDRMAQMQQTFMATLVDCLEGASPADQAIILNAVSAPTSAAYGLMTGGSSAAAAAFESLCSDPSGARLTNNP